MDAESAVRQFYKAMSTGDVSLLDDVLAPDWQDIPLPPQQAPGRDGFKAAIPWLRSVFSELAVVHDEIIVSGNTVAVRSRTSGIHQGELFGVPATGRRVEFRAFDFHRFDGGLITHSWHLEDFFGLLGQLRDEA
jgi:predicted ester cyclase